MSSRLRWYDLSDMGLIRHMPDVYVARWVVVLLVLAALSTNALASLSSGAGGSPVQMLAGVVSVVAVGCAAKWLFGKSVPWARGTLPFLAGLVGINVGLIVWLGPSGRVVALASPGVLFPLLILLGCLVWLRRRRMGLAPAPRRVVVPERSVR